MEFFDKKQDVLDIKLTRYGRQLLSRGKFKPAYYSFSDDDVIYDQRWISGTVALEPQSQVEERIQEGTPRLETLNSKVGAEVTVFNSNNGSQLQNLIDLYNISTDMAQMIAVQEDPKKGGPEEKEFQEILNSIVLDVDFADAEKLVRHHLGTKRYFTNFAPGWNVLFYHGYISGSSPTYFKKDINKKVPQVDTMLRDSFYRYHDDQDAFELNPALRNVIEKYNKYGNVGTVTEGTVDTYNDVFGEDEGIDYLNTYYESFPLQEGSVFVEKDFLLLSFEESGVDFTHENFSLEVFEIVEPFAEGAPDATSTEQLNRLMFGDLAEQATTTSRMVDAYFDVEFDTEINKILGCTLTGEKQLKTKNIYNTNVFNCEPLSDKAESTSTDIYDLDPVETEEVC